MGRRLQSILNKCLGLKPSWFKAWLHSILAVWPWTNGLTCLTVGFLIYKIRILFPKVVVGLEYHGIKYLAHRTCSVYISQGFSSFPLVQRATLNHPSYFIRIRATQASFLLLSSWAQRGTSICLCIFVLFQILWNLYREKKNVPSTSLSVEWTSFPVLTISEKKLFHFSRVEKVSFIN